MCIRDRLRLPVTRLQVGPKAFAISNGYATDRGVSNKPPIHSSVLTFEEANGLEGSNALSEGGTKWRVPGCAPAGKSEFESIVECL